MSYDLVVFEVEQAPAEDEALREWASEQSECHESDAGNAEEETSERLTAWLRDMYREFPPLNGPHAGEGADDPKTTDYEIHAGLVYASFAWSQAEEARRHVIRLAKKHAVGFYDLSGAAEGVWRPNGDIVFDAFYQLDALGQTIPSQEPIPMNQSDAVALLESVEFAGGDFFGLTDPAGTTFQVAWRDEDRMFLVDIPAPRRGGSWSAVRSRREVVELAQSLDEHIDPERIEGLTFTHWNARPEGAAGSNRQKKWWQFWK